MVYRILGVVFIVAGVWALVYRGFDVPKRSDHKLGPIEVTVKQTERVPIPTWAGVAAVAVGGGLLLWGANKK
jgi:hypothetical protein